jgi:hypothetical protein
MKGKIFNAQEVQALISGNKTQFREVIKPQPPLGCHYTINGNQSHALCFADCKTPRDERDYSKEPLVCVFPKPTSIDHRLECPYEVGQKIFCKESFVEGFSAIYYGEDAVELGGHSMLYSLKPAQHMKQEQSRLTLQIKEIRVERLADISEEDAVKQGIVNSGGFMDEKGVVTLRSDINGFKDYWNATHKKPEEKFEASPWCWIVSFEVINN